MVTIQSVRKGSAAGKAGVQAGDILLSINGNSITDVLDYRFYLTEKKITLQIHRGPELLKFSIRKGEYDDIGLEFDTFLMDDKKRCANKCVFCFIDQMPPGMRDTLYFKDDDSRLSFLMGNYVTMTNFSDADVERILTMHMSPIRISVHTTEPELRVQMMKNPRAGKVLSYLERFAAGGIEMDCQIVLCRKINDGTHLEKTISDLMALCPAVNSVSVVPAGMTRYREGLCHLTPFSREESRAVVKTVEAYAAECLERHGKRVFYASDEFYLKGELELPCGSYYEGYAQLENGVGTITNTREQFEEELSFLTEEEQQKAENFSIATGSAAYPLIKQLTEKLSQRCPGLRGTVYPIINDFFGHQITVAGLVTGQDLIAQLRGKQLGQRLLIPSVMLRHEGDRFLDDVTLCEVQQALGVPITVCESDGYGLMQGILHP